MEKKESKKKASKPVVEEKKPIVKDDEIVIAKVLPVSLSYDHRTIDGASGSHFINILKELLSDPDILLLRA